MTGYGAGDTWEEHYRGYELRINPDEEIWWQVYNGTDRLHLEPTPTDLIDQFLELKPMGGRVRVTEGGAVITRKEDEDTDGHRGSKSLDDYTSIYVGDLELHGELVPRDAAEYSVPVRPDGLNAGDLWPSVYDGARYSFSMDGNAWWHNSRTKKRHPVEGGLPESLSTGLTRLKPEGGSFRVTPWGAVVTLLQSPATQTVKDQFGDLPRVVRNIIKLRRDRTDLQMLPVYVGTLDSLPLAVEDPESLTDKLSAEEKAALDGWAESLGETSSTSSETHTANRTTSEPVPETAQPPDETDQGERGTSDEAEEEEPPMDDPISWIKESMDKTEERLNDG
jgi:hypothetical protein